jgi:predicted O-linked N-acetylglucosamine transferase (SPINDLY family)
LEDFIGSEEITNWREALLSWHIKVGGDLHLSVAIQYATMLDPFPNSSQAADDAVALYIDSAERFLQDLSPKLELDEHALSDMIPCAANDPYVHCMLSIFHLSFYHGAGVNVARMANLHYQIATRVWPALSYESKFIHKQRSSNTVNKIKLGIASGALSPGSSVAAEFSGVMQRLDRNKFEIT